MIDSAFIFERIEGYMKKRGYVPHASEPYFYRLCGDLILGVYIDVSSVHVFPTMFILPLFMPITMIHFDYGRRVHLLPGDNELMGLPVLAEKQEIEMWFAEFERVLDRCVEPYFEQVNTVEKLMTFVERNSDPLSLWGKIATAFRVRSLRLYMQGLPLSIDKLKIYGWLYQGQYDKVVRNVPLYIKNINRDKNLRVITCGGEEGIKEQLIAEAESLCTMALEGSQTVSTFLASNIARTKECLGII